MHKKEKEFYDNRISELEEVAAEGWERIKVLEQALLEKDEAVEAIKKEAAKARRALNKKTREFMKTSTENAALKAKVEALQMDVKEKTAAFSRMESMVNKLNARIRELEVEEKTLQRFLEEKDKDLAHKNDVLAKREEKIEILKDSINRLELEKGELIKKVEKLEKLF
jgi:chromosome segregation ATPase